MCWAKLACAALDFCKLICLNETCVFCIISVAFYSRWASSCCRGHARGPGWRRTAVSAAEGVRDEVLVEEDGRQAAEGGPDGVQVEEDGRHAAEGVRDEVLVEVLTAVKLAKAGLTVSLVEEEVADLRGSPLPSLALAPLAEEDGADLRGSADPRLEEDLASLVEERFTMVKPLARLPRRRSAARGDPPPGPQGGFGRGADGSTTADPSPTVERVVEEEVDEARVALGDASPFLAIVGAEVEEEEGEEAVQRSRRRPGPEGSRSARGGLSTGSTGCRKSSGAVWGFKSGPFGVIWGGLRFLERKTRELSKTRVHGSADRLRVIGGCSSSQWSQLIMSPSLFGEALGRSNQQILLYCPNSYIVWTGARPNTFPVDKTHSSLEEQKTVSINGFFKAPALYISLLTD